MPTQQSKGELLLERLASMPINAIGSPMQSAPGVDPNYVPPPASETWKKALSMGIDFLPGPGDVKAAQEAITGQNLITGDQLAWWERGLAGAGALPFLPNVAGIMREPIAVYHGTSSKFRKYKLTETYRNIDGDYVKVKPGLMFFTPDRETAQMFARDKQMIDKEIKGVESRPVVKRGYLQFDNPLDLTIDFDTKIKMTKEGYSPYYNQSAPNPYTSKIFEEMGYPIESWNDIHQLLDDPGVISNLKDMGYDAIKLREVNGAESYAIFDSSKISSKKRMSN